MPIANPPKPEPPQLPPTPDDAKAEDRPSAPDKPALPPDLRVAFEESWERHEAAYRYLGR